MLHLVNNAVKVGTLVYECVHLALACKACKLQFTIKVSYKHMNVANQEEKALILSMFCLTYLQIWTVKFCKFLFILVSSFMLLICGY